jgi:hypothetical protein
LIHAHIVNEHVGREGPIVDVEARPVPTDGEVENEEKGVLKLASAVDSIGDICGE